MIQTIEFWYGDGFAGRSYTIQVNNTYIQLCTNLGGEEGNKDAIQIAKATLADLNLPEQDNIVFKWNGRM